MRKASACGQKLAGPSGKPELNREKSKQTPKLPRRSERPKKRPGRRKGPRPRLLHLPLIPISRGIRSFSNSFARFVTTGRKLACGIRTRLVWDAGKVGEL